EGWREQWLPEQCQSHSLVHHIGKPGLQFTFSTNLDCRPRTGSYRIEPPGLLKDRSNLGDPAIVCSVHQVHAMTFIEAICETTSTQPTGGWAPAVAPSRPRNSLRIV